MTFKATFNLDDEVAARFDRWVHQRRADGLRGVNKSRVVEQLIARLLADPATEAWVIKACADAG